MTRLDVQYYLHEVRKCEIAAATAVDASTKEYWLEAARRWLTLANQADISRALNRIPKNHEHFK